MKPIIAICLPGWGIRQSPARFRKSAQLNLLEEYGVSVVTTEGSGRRLNNWKLKDVYKLVFWVDALAQTHRILLTGFSDSARIANYVTWKLPGVVDWFVFHSGRWLPKDPLPMVPTLVIGGANDWTERMPWPSNPREFYNTLAEHTSDVTWYQHSGGHEWTEESTRSVGGWLRLFTASEEEKRIQWRFTEEGLPWG